MSEKRHLVFVYGTLKRLFGNHYIIREGFSISKGNFTCKGLMFHLGAFPCVTFEEQTGEIQGEVWEVDDPTLTRLDRLEGVPNHYRRMQIETPYGQAWVYIYPRERFYPGMWVIPDGIWIGGTSPKVAWLGWGKGFAIGPLSVPDHYPPLTEKQTPWRLEPEGDGWMRLYNINTKEIEGRYRLIGDLIRHLRTESYRPAPTHTIIGPDRQLPVVVEKKEESISKNNLKVKFEQVPQG